MNGTLPLTAEDSAIVELLSRRHGARLYEHDSIDSEIMLRRMPDFECGDCGPMCTCEERPGERWVAEGLAVFDEHGSLIATCKSIRDAWLLAKAPELRDGLQGLRNWIVDSFKPEERCEDELEWVEEILRESREFMP